MKAGQMDEAKDILRRIRFLSSEDEESKVHIEHELNDIIEVVALEKKHAKRNSYWSMFWGLGE